MKQQEIIKACEDLKQALLNQLAVSQMELEAKSKKEERDRIVTMLENMKYPEEHLGTVDIKPTEMYERGFNSALTQIKNKLK